MSVKCVGVGSCSNEAGDEMHASCDSDLPAHTFRSRALVQNIAQSTRRFVASRNSNPHHPANPRRNPRRSSPLLTQLSPSRWLEQAWRRPILLACTQYSSPAVRTFLSCTNLLSRVPTTSCCRNRKACFRGAQQAGYTVPVPSEAERSMKTARILGSSAF